MTRECKSISNKVGKNRAREYLYAWWCGERYVECHQDLCCGCPEIACLSSLAAKPAPRKKKASRIDTHSRFSRRRTIGMQPGKAYPCRRQRRISTSGSFHSAAGALLSQSRGQPAHRALAMNRLHHPAYPLLTHCSSSCPFPHLASLFCGKLSF